MRPSLAAVVLLASPSLAFAAAPLCALPGPPQASAETGDQVAQARPVAKAPTPPASQNALPAKLPIDLTAIPFVGHVAASGARITDLGSAHGMRTIAARSGDQLMIFQVAPDGGAAISGATVELTPAQLKTIAAGNVTDLGSLHGLSGFFVRSGPQFQVFYATADGQRLVPGIMWDASGKDLTRQQVASIPGAIPTVEVQSATPGQTASATKALPLLEKSAFGTIGQASAPHLFMLIDPQCIYSIRAFQMLRPYVESGRVQISVVPLSILDYEDHGQSTRSALALLSKSADQLVSAWQSGDVNTPATSEATLRLESNMALAQAIGVKGTPTFVWRKPDGSEGRIDGVPASIEAILSAMGR